MIEYVTGDLLKSDETEIAHGCNTIGVMGAGIARVIAERYPIVRHQYQQECIRSDFHLGSAFPVVIMENGTVRTIWNLGTQRQPGADASLWGVMLSFGNMMERLVRWKVERVAIPRIGCGIGGLKWNDVARTIEQVQHFVGDKAPLVVVYTQESQVGVKW